MGCQEEHKALEGEVLLVSYVYVEVLQLYQVVVEQSSSDVVQRPGGFLIRLLEGGREGGGRDREERERGEEAEREGERDGVGRKGDRGRRRDHAGRREESDS